MRKNIIFFIFILFAACKSTAITSPANTGNKEVVITGLVNEIQQGKDGYTAVVKATDNLIYFVTISRANLKDPRQYKAIKIEERLRVKGELWKMGDENHITVRELQ